jgi:GNAT superfamily N-acetyltransferase
MQLLRANALHQDFITLVAELDKELAIIDGDDHAFFSTYNKTFDIHHTVIAYIDDAPVGIGAIKRYDATTMEVKRMFVLSSFRGRKIANAVLAELEKWTLELGYQSCILETSTRLPSAVKLYERTGYIRIDNYGQYIGVPTSICMLKNIKT